MVQDEFNHYEKAIANTGIKISIKAAGLTLDLISKAFKSYISHKNNIGRLPIKKLVASDKSLEQIELEKSALRPFAKYSKKCGVSYSLLKDGRTTPPTWNIFIKGKDRELVNKFVNDFVKDWESGKFDKTSILEKLHKFRSQVKKQRQVKKEKIRNPEVERGR